MPEVLSFAIDIDSKKVWLKRDDGPWMQRRQRKAKGYRKYVRKLKAIGQFKGAKFSYYLERS